MSDDRLDVADPRAEAILWPAIACFVVLVVAWALTIFYAGSLKLKMELMQTEMIDRGIWQHNPTTGEIEWTRSQESMKAMMANPPEEWDVVNKEDLTAGTPPPLYNYR